MNFRNTTFAALAADLNSCPSLGLPEIVLSGKSNVGKSSLVNALADNKKLARVSQTPGKTQAVVYFNIDNKLLLADLPGYGYAKTSKDKKEKFSKLADSYFTSGRQFNLVLHLIDSRHYPSEEDMAMIKYMNTQKIPYFLVLTKCDKFSRQQLNKQIEMFTDVLDFDENAYIFAVSSEKKTGIDDLRIAIEQYIFN